MSLAARIEENPPVSFIVSLGRVTLNLEGEQCQALLVGDEIEFAVPRRVPGRQSLVERGWSPRTSSRDCRSGP
jgi:hypothetical protein